MAKKNHKTAQWVQRHINDPFVKKASQQGYRSRAVYKLQQIDEQDKLIHKNMLIADLGSAPGGWAQYCAKKIGANGEIIAIDLLAMDPIQHVHFMQGDFQDADIQAKMQGTINNRPFDLVISDMAPNITGIKSVDEAKYEALLDSVLWFCQSYLKPQGHLLAKLFEGSAAHYFRQRVKQDFTSGVVRKPDASRSKSKEFYYLAKQKKHHKLP